MVCLITTIRPLTQVGKIYALLNLQTAKLQYNGLRWIKTDSATNLSDKGVE